MKNAEDIVANFKNREKAKSAVDWWSVKKLRQEGGEQIPFWSGEQVAVSGFLRKDDSGDYTFVGFDKNDSGYGTDYFKIAVDKDSVGPHTLPAAEHMRLILQIKKAGNSVIPTSPLRAYEARIVQVAQAPIINPTPQQMRPNTEVVLRGRVTKTSKSEKGENDYLQITTEDEQCYEVHLHNSIPNFSENLGPLENIGGKPGDIGDVVTLNVTVLRDGTLYHTLLQPMALAEASPARQKRYDGERTQIRSDLEKLASTIKSDNFSVARNVIGNLATKELTKDETRSLANLVESLPFEESVVALPSSMDRYAYRSLQRSIAEFDESFGVRILGMTPREFSVFAEQVLAGQRTPKENSPTKSAYEIFDIAKVVGFSKADLEKMVTNALQTRAQKIHGVVDPPLEDIIVIANAMQKLANLKTETSIKQLIDLLDNAIAKDEFLHKDEYRAGRPWTFMSDIVDSLRIASVGREGLTLVAKYQNNLVSALATLEEQDANESESRRALQKIINTIAEYKMEKSP